MGERTIITGAAGFVGANLARRLLRDGHEVHVLALPSAWRLRDLAHDLHFHDVDVRDRERVGAAFHGIQPAWVFHLAAHGAYSDQRDPERIVHTNTLGCMSVLDASVDVGAAAFVQTGSSSEYGFCARAASERDPIAPNSVYAISKAAATHYCALIARSRGVHAVTLRLYSIYGPFEEPRRLIPTLLVYGRRGLLPPLVSPRTARDYVYVEDAVDALLRAARSSGAPRGSVYNVCTGVQTNMETIVERVREDLRIPAKPVWESMPARSWDTDIWVGDPSLMRSELGWTAATALREGLARTAAWLGESEERFALYEARVSQASRP